MPPLERRASSLLTAALVDEPAGSARPTRVGGVGLPYGQLANIGGVFQERFDPGCLRERRGSRLATGSAPLRAHRQLPARHDRRRHAEAHERRNRAPLRGRTAETRPTSKT